MSEHSLKCWPEPFAAILSGEKRHEVRKNDRGYAVGDMLRLRSLRTPVRGTRAPRPSPLLDEMLNIPIAVHLASFGLTIGDVESLLASNAKVP